MELEKAIVLLQKIVKENGTNDQKHLDLGLVPTDERAIYEEALKIVKIAIIKGKLSQDEFMGRVHLN
jgi:hypothetical protein